MKDTHATVVTKYFAKTLFLQLYVLLMRLSCFTFRITCDFDYKISLDGQTQLFFDNPQGCHLLWQPSLGTPYKSPSTHPGKCFALQIALFST